MSDKLTENQRLQWMLLSLVMIVGLIIGLAALIFISPRLLATHRSSTAVMAGIQTTPSLTLSLQPFASPTQTNTPRPTLSPTITPSPSITPTPPDTPTPAGPPTLTPARPMPQSANYVLATWSVEEARHMISLMEDYPNTLPNLAEEDQAGYYQAFQYAVFALQESLINIPAAQQDADWPWKLAYNLARVGDEAAGKEYAGIISTALTRGDVDLSQLYLWFQEREPRLSLYMAETRPPRGYLSSHLVEIRGSGSAILWLVEKPGGFQAIPLVSHFDFANQPQVSWILAELNGSTADGDELAVYFSNNPGDYQLHPPLVFNLDKIPAVLLPFFPEGKLFDLGMQFTNQWSVVPSTGIYNDLAFQSQLFPTCPLNLSLLFRWNGAYFELINDRYIIAEKPANLASCQLLAEHAARFWGAKAAVNVMEPLLPGWPPALDLNGKPYPADAHDEWRFRLGVYAALLGDAGKAVGWMQENIDTPSLPLSSWIAPSKDFLQVYKNGQELYRACVSVDFCDANAALKSLVAGMHGSKDIMEELWNLGMQSHASGYFDFELDRQSERWFTLRHRPLEALQFWILGQYSGGVEALFAGQVDASPPQIFILDPDYVREDGLQYLPVVFLDNYLAFSLRRMPLSSKPYLLPIPLRQEYPDKFGGAVAQAESELFSGTRPAEVYKQLKELQDYPGLLCQNNWSCDRYFYLLGLSAELAGDTQAAIEAFHRVWLDYSRSPFTTMARLKLAGSPTYISPTPTLSLTPSGTVTPLPTVSGTPPTNTPTVSRTPPTNTPTVSGTPPTPTPTITSGVVPTATRTPTSLYPPPAATTALYP